MRPIAVPLLAAVLASCAYVRPPIRVERIAPCTQGTLGLEPGAHNIIAAVIPGGPADRAGLMKGDVVLSVGGSPIANSCELIDAAFGRRNCAPVAVGVQRDGKAIAVTVVPAPQAAFYKKTCEAGDVTACFRLAWMTWSGDGVLHDEERAMEMYADACAKGSAEACAYRGLHLQDEDDVKTEDVVAALSRACDLGSAAGCAHLAFLYATGTLVTHDDARATPLYVKSCELGDANGCYNVGLMYADGRGVAADVHRAVAAYEEGCREGSTTACTNLGYYYERGENVAKDEKRAFELFRRGCAATSCQGSNLRGCVNLGRAYRDGIGTERDPARAAKVFDTVCYGVTKEEDPGADENQARACALLGALYLTGDGVKKDLAEGLDLSERACEMDDSFGCFNAARVWATGLGVDRDAEKATGFYRNACDLDDGEACYELAQLVDAERGPELRKKACKLGFEKACSGL